MDRLLVRIALYLMAPLVASFLTYLFMSRLFFEPLEVGSDRKSLIEVGQELTFGELSQNLMDKGIIRSAFALKMLARFRKGGFSIHVGEYELSPAMRPSEILEQLATGKTFKRLVEVREGMTVWEIAALLEAAKLVTDAEFSKALVNSGLLAALGINSPSFEGYLWPMNYELSRPITANQIIRKMVDEAEKRWPQSYTDRTEELKMNRHSVLTMASIIQREALMPDEMPIVASVIHNRLAKGMRLQSDATVIYGLPSFNGTLTKADRESALPYNTYVNFGLPPGPICNPGEAAIRATLWPAESEFLFFLHGEEGRLQFFTTLEEYNLALAKSAAAQPQQIPTVNNEANP